jgi:asparagine synthase (glutamine-hydrolysing)
MWAVVIVDLARGRLVLSRDRLGIKPLFFATEGTRTIVASHARTVAQALASGPEIDCARWHRFLRGLPAETADGSFFARVRAVPAGSILTIGLASSGVQDPQPRRYWSLDGCLPDPGDRRTDESAKEELLHLLEASTRDHMIADREVGCLLSGGLDSSVVACLAAREGRRTDGMMTCFSIVFDDPRMSEWPYIQSVAAHAGVRSITHRLAPGEAFALIDEVVAAQGEPLLGQDTIAHYRVFGLAREHDCVVALEGQAADELFAGLPSYEAVMFREWLGRGAWLRVLHEVRLRARAQGRSARSVFREYALGRVVRSWTTRRRPAWLDPERASSTEPHDEPRERSADPSLLNRYLFDLVRHTNLPAVLLIQDRNAMAHGVENRPPFLDHRIVEWAFRLPSSSKVSQGRRKRVLWNAARSIVPPLVLARTDKRAIVSRGDWMPLRTAHREAVAAMADSRTLREAPYIRASETRTFVHDYLRGAHDDGMGVWRLYTAWRWLERFRPAA